MNDNLNVHAYDSDDVVYEELRRLQSLCDGYRKIAHDATRLYFEVGIEYDKLKSEYVKLQQELHTSQNPHHPAY